MKVHHVILVVLLLLIALGASVLFTFSFSDRNGKEDDALMQSMNLQQCAKTYSMRNLSKRVENLDDLIPYTVHGEHDIVDPWGNRFRFQYVMDPKSGEEQFVAWTVNPTNGKVLSWPREAAERIDKEK